MRDPLSIFSLANSSLNICHEILKKTDIEFYRTALVFYAQTAYIIEEKREAYHKEKYSARNYFKSPAKEIDQTLEFDPKVNALQIFEALQCIKRIEGNTYIPSPEIYLFTTYFLVSHHDILIDEFKKYLDQFKASKNFEKLMTADIDQYNETLAYFKENIDLFRKLIKRESLAA
jgi:hypothetical protein